MFNSNQQLVAYLQKPEVLESEQIIEAFWQIDRRDFVPAQSASQAYDDVPLPLGHGATISQPTTVALMLELLAVQIGDKVLDIGSGSGWPTALLGHLVGRQGNVTGVDIVPELVEFGQVNLAKYDLPQAKIIQAKPDEPGLPGQTFDKILVSAAASAYPRDLLKQLKSGGRLVVPIRESVYKIDKDRAGKISQAEYPGFVFVPLR